MDRALARGACSPVFGSSSIQKDFPSYVKGGRREMEPVMIKLHGLAAPIEKVQVIAFPSMGKCSKSER